MKKQKRELKLVTETVRHLEPQALEREQLKQVVGARSNACMTMY